MKAAQTENAKAEPQIKILYYRNHGQIESDSNIIRSTLIPMIDELAEKFSELNIGKFNQEFYSDFYLNNCRLTKKTIERQLEIDLSSTKNVKLRNSMREMLRDIDDDEIPFFEFCHDPRFNQYRQLLSYVTIKDGNAIYSPESEAILVESYSKYITDPKAKDAYDAHIEAAESLTKMAKAWGRIPGFSIGQYFEFDERNKIFKTVVINYERLF